MFRQLIIGGILVAVTALFPTHAPGAVVDDLVFFEQNELEDDDWEILVNSGGTITNPGMDTSIDVGDYLVGMFRITALFVPPGGTLQAFYPPSPGNETFAGVFALKVESKGPVNPANDRAEFSFGPATLAEWIALDIPFTPSALGTVAIIFDDPDNIDPTIADGPDADDSSVNDSIVSVGGAELWEIGFDGDPDLFWRATATAKVAPPFAAPFGGEFSAAVNVTETTGGPPLAPQSLGPIFGLPGDADVVLVGGSVSIAAAAVNDWDVKSDVDILITPIPEMSGVTVWGGLLLSGLIPVALVRRGRRRQLA